MWTDAGGRTTLSKGPQWKGEEWWPHASSSFSTVVLPPALPPSCVSTVCIALLEDRDEGGTWNNYPGETASILLLLLLWLSGESELQGCSRNHNGERSTTWGCCSQEPGPCTGSCSSTAELPPALCSGGAEQLPADAAVWKGWGTTPAAPGSAPFAAAVLDNRVAQKVTQEGERTGTVRGPQAVGGAVT